MKNEPLTTPGAYIDTLRDIRLTEKPEFVRHYFLTAIETAVQMPVIAERDLVLITRFADLFDFTPTNVSVIVMKGQQPEKLVVIARTTQLQLQRSYYGIFRFDGANLVPESLVTDYITRAHPITVNMWDLSGSGQNGTPDKLELTIITPTSSPRAETNRGNR